MSIILELGVHIGVAVGIWVDFNQIYEHSASRVAMVIGLVGLWMRFITIWGGFRKIGFCLRIFKETLGAVRWFWFMIFYFIIFVTFMGNAFIYF